MRLVFDAETDGLLDTVTTIHVIRMIDRDTGKRLRFTDHETYHDGTLVCANGSIADALALLEAADVCYSANGIKYDAPVFDKLRGPFRIKKHFDTRVASAVIWPNLTDVDFGLIRSGKLPEEFQKKGLIGRNSVEAWGWRLGERKGDFNPKDYGYTWADVPFLREMGDYCGQDVETTLKWIEKIESKNYSTQCLDLEMRVAEIIAAQERRGFAFDMKAAEALYVTLTKRKAELDAELQVAFPPWEVKLDDFIPKRNNKTRGYIAGVPVPRTETKVFNPGSRHHIADRLEAMRGWRPSEFTKEGTPKIDETVLGALPYPEAKLIAEYLLVTKYIGQVSDGDNSWFKFYKEGRIHGTVNSNGAVTGRMTHARPNIAQVPKVGSPYGAECRALFTASPGLVLVGCDAEGLELRMLAHFMAKWDGGAYVETVVNGRKEDETDVHNVNKKAAGLNSRDAAKTTIYGLMYGAGDLKLGTIIYDDFTEAQRMAFDTKYPAADPKARDSAFAGLGKKRRARLMESLPAFKKLVDAVKARAKTAKSLPGLDGRVLHVRSEHSALNVLLQSAGALVMKQAAVILFDSIENDPELNGRVWLVASIHDEYQLETHPDLADKLGRLAAESIRLAGEHFNLRCPLAGAYATGTTWRCTH